MDDINREIDLENVQRIKKMSKQEIEKAKQEIMERFGEFLQVFVVCIFRGIKKRE